MKQKTLFKNMPNRLTPPQSLGFCKIGSRRRNEG